MSHLAALPIFVAVVEKQGFAPAAQFLNVSKSAISKRISQLEEHLGARLLYRSTRKVSLTEAGQRYYELAVEALAKAQDAECAVSELHGKPKGKLKINIPMSFGRLHIVPIIPKFLSLYPNIEIDVAMDDRVIDLVDSGFDMGIRGGVLPDSSLIARKIAPCQMVLAASPQYLEKYGVPATPHDLRKHNCLHYAYYRDQNTWELRGPNGLVKIATTGNFRINNSEALMQATLNGCGIARLPTFVSHKHILSGDLVRLLPEYEFPKQTFYAVFPERKFLPSKIRAFIDFIQGEIGRDQPYWDIGIFPGPN
jgi:DNA-binding transcriptional LysR family regulator